MGKQERAGDADTESVPPDGLAAVSALGEPTRRALYEYVAAAGAWVGRDTAADAVGLERGTAAHHLDRLAADGLLDVDYRRLSGRQGPGAGRPSKLYRRARRDVEVTLPPRDYGLLARLLAAAVDASRADGVDIASALDTVTRAEGRRLGEEMRAGLDADEGDLAARRDVIVEVLTAHGFEPRCDPSGTIVLQNCPFHQIAARFTELICGMNHSLLSAAIESLGRTGLEARLEPEEGSCCVRLRSRSARRRSIAKIS